MSQDNIIDVLSNLSHEQWSGWMKYLFSKSKKQKDGSVVIPKEFVDRWKRQIDTSYENLSEKEKDSDRKEAKRVLKTILKYDEEKNV